MSSFDDQADRYDAWFDTPNGSILASKTAWCQPAPEAPIRSPAPFGQPLVGVRRAFRQVGGQLAAREQDGPDAIDVHL